MIDAKELLERWVRATDPTVHPITGPDVRDQASSSLMPAHHDPRSRRWMSVAAVVVVAAALAGAGLVKFRADRATGTSPSTTSTTASTTTTAVPAMSPAFPPPAGMTAVSDHEGNVVGYIHSGTLDIDTPPEPHAFGTAGRVFGPPVFDRDGNTVGYFLAELGFVTTEQAADPGEIDRLVAENKVFQRRAQELQPQTTTRPAN